jgi:signal transduction histidine kinase
MVELLRAEANLYAVSIRIDLVADLPKITADRVQLQQVFVNLILNAVEAMKETGEVLTVETELGENGQMLISVSDTGVGLPNRTNLFWNGRELKICNSLFSLIRKRIQGG